MSPNLDSPIQTQMAVAVVKSPLGNGECNGTIRMEGNSRKETCLCSNRDGLHFGDGVGPDGDELILMTVEVGTSRRGGVATQPGMLQLGASGDASAVHQDFNKNTSGKKQRYKKRSRTKSDGSESLSDIDDSAEMHLKRMLWEAMNKEHVKVKKQKPATEIKKTTTARKAVKTTEKLEQQKRSSRINYDALRILSDDMEQGSGTANDVDLKLDSWRNDYSQNESITTPKMQRSEDGNYGDDDDDDQQQITCGEDDVIYGHHNDTMSYGYEDEYDENFDFGD